MPVSPFKYKEYDLKVEQGKNDVSNSHIHKMKVEGHLYKEDIEILNLIFDYKYLNSFGVKTFFSKMAAHESITDISVKSVSQRLKKLNKHGMLIRYYFQHLSDGENPVLKRTPYFYALSRGAFEFVKKHRGSKIKANDYFNLPSNSELLRKVSLNQLVLNFSVKGQGVLGYEMDIPLQSKSYNKQFSMMALFTVDSDSTDKVIAESVRRSPNWQVELKTRLDYFYDYIRHNKFTDIEIPVIVLLGEDDDHLVEIQRHVVRNSPLKSLIYYTTDTALLVDDLRGSLFSIELQGDTDYNLTELKVDFLEVPTDIAPLVSDDEK